VFQPANVYPDREKAFELSAAETLEVCAAIEPEPPFASKVTANVGVQRMMTMPEPPLPP